jgi:hypothetical protein
VTCVVVKGYAASPPHLARAAVKVDDPRRHQWLGSADMSRTVALVLLNPNGELRGALTPFEVDLPWWQEASDVVHVVQERCGPVVDVLRLLSG